MAPSHLSRAAMLVVRRAVPSACKSSARSSPGNIPLLHPLLQLWNLQTLPTSGSRTNTGTVGTHVQFVSSAFFKNYWPHSWSLRLVGCNTNWETLDGFINLIRYLYSSKSLAQLRPIALLNSIYKVYASMIQVRLAKASDEQLQKTQYGSRHARNTSTLTCIKVLETA